MRRLTTLTLSCLLILGTLALAFSLSAYFYNSHAHYQSNLRGWPPSEFFTQAVQWKPANPEQIRILSIDGGAMHGLSSLEILKEIENQAGRPISDLFDFVAGTSTGAIIGTALLLPDEKGKPKYSVDAVIAAYRDLGRQIFSAPLYHKVLTLDGVLGPMLMNHTRFITSHDLFTDRKFGDLLKPAMVPVFSQHRTELQVFLNLREPDANLFMAPLISAATSVPAVFPAVELTGYNEHDGLYSDAALILNNPVQTAFLHALERSPDAEFIVVSIGTVTEAEVTREEGVKGGIWNWLQPMMSMVIAGQSRNSENDLLMLQEVYPEIRLRSFRFAPQFPWVWNTFDASDKNVEHIEKIGKDYVLKNTDKISEAVKMLIENKPVELSEN
ncbi:MAG: patatin-like phospholipase family protein [Stappiaceae bacterium]